MKSLSEFFYHLRMGEPFFSSRSLYLGNSELFKKIKSRLESFIIFDAHYNKVALSVNGNSFPPVFKKNFYHMILIRSRANLRHNLMHNICGKLGIYQLFLK